jgi:hypothetical protein
VIDHVEIAPVPPRQTPGTRQIVTQSAPLDREPVITQAYGSIVRIFPDGSAIVEVAGDATISTNTGQLGRTQVAIRLNPPATSNAKPTEILK